MSESIDSGENTILRADGIMFSELDYAEAMVLRNLIILKNNPETRAILQSLLQDVLDSDLAKRVQALEAKLEAMNGDGK